MVIAVSNLSEFLANAKGDRSIDDIAKQAASAGHRISRSVVAKYLRGEHGAKPPEATLAGLAAGLGVDVRVLRELAGRPAGEREPYDPPAVSASLTRKQRRALDQLILAMVEGDDDDRQSEADEMRVSTRDDMTLATRRGASAGRAQWDRAQTLGEESQDDGGMEPA